MKKHIILTAVFSLFICFGSFAQHNHKDSTKSDTAMMMKDCCMKKDGKMMCVKDGKMMAMDSSMTMKDGTKCMPNGECIMKNGKKMTLKEGEAMNIDGKIVSLYTCPMHPEVTSDKPGKCPKCEMDLVKKKVE